jgi:hypothetical protein
MPDRPTPATLPGAGKPAWPRTAAAPFPPAMRPARPLGAEPGPRAPRPGTDRPADRRRTEQTAGALTPEQYVRRIAVDAAAHRHRGTDASDERIIATAARLATYITNGR